MFADFMTNTWIVGTVVAVIAGLVGFFVVLRGAAFVAHAVPNGAFAGAAAADLLGVNTVLGLGVCAVLAALGIGRLGRTGRTDVVTALALVFLLGLGSLLLSLGGSYEPEVFSLLFGEVLGVSDAEVGPTLLLGVLCAAAIAVLYRPLLYSSVLPGVAAARGLRPHTVELVFLVVVALATSLTVPVVGALLIFSLMIGPPAAARSVTDRPLVALGLSVVIAVLTVWVSIACSYLTDWPVGFFVGVLGAAGYGLGRAARLVRARRPRRAAVTPAAIGGGR